MNDHGFPISVPPKDCDLAPMDDACWGAGNPGLRAMGPFVISGDFDTSDAVVPLISRDRRRLRRLARRSGVRFSRWTGLPIPLPDGRTGTLGPEPASAQIYIWPAQHLLRARMS